MSCRDVIAFLDRYLAGELAAPVRQRFEGHLAECRACRGYLRTYRDTITMAGSLREPAEAAGQAPAELVEAVMSALRGPVL